MLDSKKIKKEFPFFDQPKNQKLVYLDNSATTQKPQAVLSAITQYYLNYNANVGRSIYPLSKECTKLFFEAREKIASFFGTKHHQFVITRNTTEAINGVIWGWAVDNLKSKDVVLITKMEHHSNLVPWQQVCARTGAKLVVVNITDQGMLDWQDLEEKLKKHQPKLFASTHVSNVLGTFVDPNIVARLIKKHSPETLFLLDAAQSAGTIPIDFKKLKVDFLVFSGHKMYGPMGIGGLLIRGKLLKSQEMKPWLFGGGMIKKVKQEFATFHPDSCERFTAGTPDVASVLGLAAACDYLTKLGLEKILEHDQLLVKYALEKLLEIDQVKIVGPTVIGNELTRVGSVAFIHKKYHAHDVAQVLSHHNIAVRSGWHCCEPLHSSQRWSQTVRISFGVYNSCEEIDKAIKVIKNLEKYLV